MPDLCYKTPVRVRSRQILVLGLIAVFFVQTFLVYADPEGRRMPALSELAGQGQTLWRKNNCQSCHQLYGFGGFLGPDLTNGVERLTPSRLESILTVGSERMPAFGLSAAERRAVACFLDEVDRTGVSQPKLGPSLSTGDLFAQLFDAAVGVGDDGSAALTEAEHAGRVIVFEQNCIDCHLPNGRSAYRAPDLTRAVVDSGAARVLTVLTEGVPEKGMPRFDLSAAERESVLAFLTLLGHHGAPIRDGFESAQRRSGASFRLPPWFEYPQR